MVLALEGQADFAWRMREGVVHCANENGVRNVLEGSECLLILFHGGRVLRGEAGLSSLHSIPVETFLLQMED